MESMDNNQTLNGSDIAIELHNQVLVNFTRQHDPDKYDIMQNPVLRTAMFALYILVIVIGIIGNTIVVLVVTCKKNMQNVTNMFIANLALSDIGLGIFCLPMQLHYQLTDHWIFGEIMCHAVFAAFAVPMYVSTLTILLIAFDRYRLIIHPFEKRMTKLMACFWICVSVAFSILLTIPVIVFTKLIHIVEPEIHLDRTYCLEDWPSDTARLIYTLLTFHLQFCLPLGITAYFYFRIYSRLRLRNSHRSRNHDQTQKTNRILVSIVLLFALCWLPWNLFTLMTEIDGDIVMGRYFKFIDLILKLIAMGSSCINPLLYGWLNDNFRKELDNMAVRLHVLTDKSRSNQMEALHNAHGLNGKHVSKTYHTDVGAAV